MEALAMILRVHRTVIVGGGLGGNEAVRMRMKRNIM